MGQARSGKVPSLVGMGMYGAFAAGGPPGLARLDRIGFGGLMAVCTLLPLIGGLQIWLSAGPELALLADHTGCATVFLIGGPAATLGLWMAVSAHRVVRATAPAN